MMHDKTNLIGDYQDIMETRLEALKCAKKGHAIEEKRKKQGWRFVKITPTYQVFVPCDKKGNPTEDGIRRLNRQRKLLGII